MKLFKILFAIAATLTIAAPAAMAQAVDLTPASIAAVATAVNDDAAARDKRAAAPKYFVYRGFTSPPVEMTVPEVVAKYGGGTGTTIMVKPAGNGAKLATCADWRDYARWAVWNTGAGQGKTGRCPGNKVVLVRQAGQPLVAERRNGAGELVGISFHDGTGYQVVDIVDTGIIVPKEWMTIFVKQ